MLKKTVVLGSLLTGICASPTLAHSTYFKSGFLAGGHVGVSFGSGKFNSTYSINPAFLNNSSSANGTARKTATLIGISGGYRHIFNQGYTVAFNLEANFFINNELNKQLAHFTSPPPAVSVNNRLKKNFNVIPSISLGKIFCGQWHASIGLGLAFAKFRQQVNVLSPINVSTNTSQTKLGVVPSVGLEYAATKNVSLIGNISYEIYKKVSKKFSNSNFGPAPSSYTSSISPRYVAMKVGAVYKF